MPLPCRSPSPPRSTPDDRLQIKRADLAKEFVRRHRQRGGDREEGGCGGIPLAPLEETHVVHVQVAPLREFGLGGTRRPPSLAERESERDERAKALIRSTRHAR